MRGLVPQRQAQGPLTPAKTLSFRERGWTQSALFRGFLDNRLQQNITAGRHVFGGRVLNFVMTDAILTGDEDHR